MRERNNIIRIALLLLLIISVAGCTENDAKRERDFNKCSLVCAQVLDEDDFMNMDLCRQECKKQFLNSNPNK